MHSAYDKKKQTQIFWPRKKKFEIIFINNFILEYLDIVYNVGKKRKEKKNIIKK